MSSSPKIRKSVPLSQEATVDVRQVYVAVEGIDLAGIPSSFSVHLLKDGRRIASRFMFRPSGGEDLGDEPESPRLAHVDFPLPIDAVAGGRLSVEIEPTEPSSADGRPLESMGHPRMSVYLMLEIE
jgi:tyrosinase